MDEDFGFDSGFDDVGSADLDIDSGFDDSSFDTDFSMDDIGSDEIISDDFSETDLSMDMPEEFDVFDDVESTELDMAPTEDELLIEADDGLELPDESFEADEITDLSADDSSLELDDFNDDVDTLDTEDASSLSDLDTDDFDDIYETEDVTDDIVEDEESIADMEDEGYFENIPNEMEPFVMEEAQAETDSDVTETFPEFEEESPEESESGLEKDVFEETELSDDTVSNELPSAETDNDTPGEEINIEETDAPEGDKTPYEAMRDYMYEHDYGQMDYPEYSQDPEWQALNGQYTASLEETPAADEIPADQGWDTPDITEPQELHDDEVIDIYDEATDGATDTDAVQDTSDKTLYEAMRDYMYEHDYGQMDYPEYSQDPEWQALNEQYTASLEETPAADEIPADQGWDTPDITEPQELHDGEVIDIHDEAADGATDTDAVQDTSDKTPYEAMRDYMYEHDYGQMDYPEYSQDPEWQALNEQYIASLENTQSLDELSGKGDMDSWNEAVDSPEDTIGETVSDISDGHTSDAADSNYTQELNDSNLDNQHEFPDDPFNTSELYVAEDDLLTDIPAEIIEPEIADASTDMPSDIAADVPADMPADITGDVTNDISQPSDTSDMTEILDVSSWIKEINPNYDPFDLDSAYDNNCGSCAFAVNKRLDGDTDIVASAENIGTVEEMNAATGMEQVPMTPEEIEQALLEQGNGAHAIIGIDRADGPGHWFNAANIDGKIVAIDGQDGSTSDWPPDYGDVTNWDMSVKKQKG